MECVYQSDIMTLQKPENDSRVNILAVLTINQSNQSIKVICNARNVVHKLESD